MSRSVVLLCGLAVAAVAPPARPWGGGYRSPYTLRYEHPVRELIRDLEETGRGSRRGEAAVPFDEWYSAAVRHRWGAWGPPARHYPAAEYAAGKPAGWRRERVIATAMRFRGYGYQHHHVPDWDPPADWPWLKVGAGRNGRGVDCSNFTSFVYNQGFGVRPSGAIREQAERLEVPGPGGRPVRAERVDLPAGYADLPGVLKTGDLLYIRGTPGGEVTHVVIWVGEVGRSPDGLPLVLDSHGGGVKDARGEDIPAGVHLRPFGPHSWYARCASHAHRLIRDE
jgi:cell wall-associated NlpC family hydrolase